jgi:hypothetical protein
VSASLKLLWRVLFDLYVANRITFLVPSLSIQLGTPLLLPGNPVEVIPSFGFSQATGYRCICGQCVNKGVPIILFSIDKVLFTNICVTRYYRGIIPTQKQIAKYVMT